MLRQVQHTTWCWQSILWGVLMLPSMTGCQVDISGQTLPSPYFLSDDLQYFPPGSEFVLQREADAMKAQHAEEVLDGQP